MNRTDRRSPLQRCLLQRWPRKRSSGPATQKLLAERGVTDVKALQAQAEAEFRRVFSDVEIAAKLSEIRRLGILMMKTEQADAPGAPGCWFGGAPRLPVDIGWPWYVRNGEPQTPMHFIAQLDLRHVPFLQTVPEMPRSGSLFFFHAPLVSRFDMRRGPLSAG